jgi:hypothetical protein
MLIVGAGYVHAGNLFSHDALPLQQTHNGALGAGTFIAGAAAAHTVALRRQRHAPLRIEASTREPPLAGWNANISGAPRSARCANTAR